MTITPRNDEFASATEKLKSSILQSADILTPVDIFCDAFDAEDVPAYFDFTSRYSYQGGERTGVAVDAELIGINLNGRAETRTDCIDWFGQSTVTAWERAAAGAEMEARLS